MERDYLHYCCCPPIASYFIRHPHQPKHAKDRTHIAVPGTAVGKYSYCCDVHLHSSYTRVSRNTPAYSSRFRRPSTAVCRPMVYVLPPKPRGFRALKKRFQQFPTEAMILDYIPPTKNTQRHLERWPYRMKRSERRKRAPKPMADPGWTWCSRTSRSPGSADPNIQTGYNRPTEFSSRLISDVNRGRTRPKHAIRMCSCRRMTPSGEMTPVGGIGTGVRKK